MVKGETKSKAQRSNEHRSIKDWPESERPREKLLQLGPEGLSDGELLAVLLRIGALGQSAEDLARQLMAQFNGINGIDRAHVEDLPAVPGMGVAKTAQLKAAVGLLDRIGSGLGAEGITSLLDPRSPAKQLLETFKAAQQQVPKRVFLARWYPAQDAPHNAFNKANLRLQQLQETLTAIERDHGVRLDLIDMGTEEGGAFPIHNRMYEGIRSSDIIICYLTGQRPNVFVEAGFALKHHEKNRLIFLFEPQKRNEAVPFDLKTFKYVPISQAAEIPNKVKAEIVAILRDTGAPI